MIKIKFTFYLTIHRGIKNLRETSYRLVLCNLRCFLGFRAIGEALSLKIVATVWVTLQRNVSHKGVRKNDLRL